MTDPTPQADISSTGAQHKPIVQQPVGRSEPSLPEGYAEWIAEVKDRVRATQFRAARAANTEVMVLYWSIGHDILDRQAQLGWGAGIVDRTAVDLHREFPDQQGWSRRNVHWMRKVAEVWPTRDDFVHHVGAHLPWRHITVLADRLTTREERDWYADRAAEEGWSRSVLEHFIKVNLHQSLGAAPTNFGKTLDSPDSDLAQQLVKDPYVFEHLAYVQRVNERSIEQALMDRLHADYEGLPPDARAALPSMEELRTALAEAAAEAERSQEPRHCRTLTGTDK